MKNNNKIITKISLGIIMLGSNIISATSVMNKVAYAAFIASCTIQPQKEQVYNPRTDCLAENKLPTELKQGSNLFCVPYQSSVPYFTECHPINHAPACHESGPLNQEQTAGVGEERTDKTASTSHLLKDHTREYLVGGMFCLGGITILPAQQYINRKIVLARRYINLQIENYAARLARTSAISLGRECINYFQGRARAAQENCFAGLSQGVESFRTAQKNCFAGLSQGVERVRIGVGIGAGVVVGLAAAIHAPVLVVVASVPLLTAVLAPNMR